MIDAARLLAALQKIEPRQPREKGGSGELIEGGAGADRYVAAANAGKPAGYDNWRLPAHVEAMSLMAAEQHGSYHLTPVFEVSTAPFIWTADKAGADRWFTTRMAGTRVKGLRSMLTSGW